MALIRLCSLWYFVWQTLKLLTFTTKMFFFLFLFKLQRFSGFCEEKNVTSLVLRRQNIFCINVLHFFVYLLEDELKLTLISNEILDRPKGLFSTLLMEISPSDCSHWNLYCVNFTTVDFFIANIEVYELIRTNISNISISFLCQYSSHFIRIYPANIYDMTSSVV